MATRLMEKAARRSTVARVTRSAMIILARRLRRRRQIASPRPIRSRNVPHQSLRQPSPRNQVKFYAIKVAADQSKEVVDSPITYTAILSEKSATDWAYHAARSSTIRAACFPVLAYLPIGDKRTPIRSPHRRDQAKTSAPSHLVPLRF
jgi:hypothetical protein